MLAMLPFLNDVVVAWVSGARLAQIFAHSVAALAGDDAPLDGRFLQVSNGTRVAWYLKSEEDPEIAEITLDGEPLDGDRLYRVATIAWIASGGDGYPAMDRVDSVGATSFDAVATYLAAFHGADALRPNATYAVRGSDACPPVVEPAALRRVLQEPGKDELFLPIYCPKPVGVAPDLVEECDHALHAVDLINARDDVLPHSRIVPNVSYIPCSGGDAYSA